MKPTTIKQLNEIIDRLALTGIDERDYKFVKEKIANIIRSEMPTRNDKFNYYKYVSTDFTRPSMTGVYHDKGYKVASNSHILIATKEDYPEELEGKIMLKNGEFIDGCYKYPKWESVIPALTDSTDYSKYVLCDVKHDEWKEIYDRYKAEKKIGTQHTLVKLNVDFDCYFKVELFNLYMLALKEVGADCFYIQTFEKRNYLDSEHYYTKSQTHMIFYNSDNAKVLLCPYKANDNEETYLLNIK